MIQFDAIIIGAGQSGTPLAGKLAGVGIHTALIEKRAVGGTCVNDGCTPTKAMIASAETAYRAAHAGEWGIEIPDYTVNFTKVIDRKNQIVKEFRESSEKKLKNTKDLVLFNGEACFIDHKTISVKLESGIETLTAENIFIDAGLEPEIPALKGLDQVPFFTSTSILNIAECPEHLLILGGNYTGLELGQMFGRLGSKVTIIERSSQLLPKEDEDISKAVKDILEAEGVQVFTDAHEDEVSGDQPTLTFTSHGKQQKVAGTHLLLATGRIPQTAALDLDKTGVKLDEKGFIKVNDQLETNVKGIFAMGDIKGGPAFTHISYNDYVVVFQNFMEGTSRNYSNRQLPYCMFTQPQLGRVGITEKEAREKGMDITIAALPMSKSARGMETGHPQGLMKAVVEKPTGQILGVAILSDQGGEVMSVLQMAMAGSFTAAELQEHVFAHPLYTESINNLFS